MSILQKLESRRASWSELEACCKRFSSIKRIPSEDVYSFAALYRAACADLALCDAYHLDPRMAQYLRSLVAHAHLILYRSELRGLGYWIHVLFSQVPVRLFTDPILWVTFLLFWGTFLGSMLLAQRDKSFTATIIGDGMIQSMEKMYSEPMDKYLNADDHSGAMAGFYLSHNTGIGIRCFAMGILLGIGGMFEMIFNAVVLGSVFGHMSTTVYWDNFSRFVTAHGPFELTAIVLCTASGARIGWSIISTGGYSRREAIKHAAMYVMPSVILFVMLFFGAAFIEGFISPSPSIPYWVKQLVALITGGMLAGYIIGLGGLAWMRGSRERSDNLMTEESC